MPSRFEWRLARRSRLAAPAILFLLMIVSGCSPRGSEIARVGPRSITVEEFMDVARVNAQQYPPTGDPGRQMLFDDLVRRDLMLAAADHLGLFRDSSVVATRARLEDEVLTRTLYQRLAPNDIAVSLAEVDSFMLWRATEAHIQVIFAPNREMADAALYTLHSGLEFGAVADRFSPPGMLPPGGDLGFLQPGAMVHPLDELLITAPLGRVLGPLEGPGHGWFIVRVLERRKVASRPPAEMERPWVTSTLQQRKQRAASSQAFTTLAEKYRVTVVPGAPEALFMIANRQKFAADSAGALTPAQRATVLVRYEDGSGRPLTYTVGDVLAGFDRGGQRPDFNQVPALQTWLESQAVQRAAVIEARRRHLQEEPAIAKQIEERINNQVLERLFGQVVAGVGEPTSEEVQASYQRHASSYFRLDEAHVLHVTFPDSAAAETMGRHGGHAGTLRDAAKMMGAESRVVEERLRFPNPNQAWQGLQASFMRMAPGEWMGPMRVPAGWMLLQMVDKKQVTQDWDKLPPVIQQNLRDDAIAIKRDRRLAEFIDSLKTVIRPIEVHRDRLGRIPWPVPPADAPTGT